MVNASSVLQTKERTQTGESIHLVVAADEAEIMEKVRAVLQDEGFTKPDQYIKIREP